MVALVIGNEADEIMIDSGAQVNTITLSHWKRICSNKNSNIANVTFNPSSHLKGYDGSAIECSARFEANIRTQDGLRKLKRETFHVVPKAKCGLVSFATAKRLRLIRIGSEVNVVEAAVEPFPKIPNLSVSLKVDESVEPVKNCSYRIPWSLQPSTQRQLDELERRGIIEKAPADTKWMSKLSSVEKSSEMTDKHKEPERRLVINMRAVNEAIKRVNHPMPYLDNFLPMLSGAKFFTKLDLTSAYYHVELAEELRNLTAFMTAKGPRQFTRLPFGINAAPEIFQKTMETILEGINGVIVYLDDILIFGKTMEELEERTGITLSRLRKNCLTINQKKSEFGKERIKFLGHRISASGIVPTVDKLEAITNFRRPANKSELRSFLGLVTYIGAHLTNLSEKTFLLREMTRKDVRFYWGETQKQAFADLKQFVRNEIKERGYFQTNAETLLFTDASPNALGAVLVQLQKNEDTEKKEPKIIMCLSKSLSATEKKYPQTHKEALAIVWAVEKLHFYLLGRHFTIYTDHEPMEFVFKKKNVSDKRAMTRAEGWALRLSSYNFSLAHVPTDENIADPLSRICEQKDPAYTETDGSYGLFAITPSFSELVHHWNRTRINIETIKAETESDRASQLLINGIANGSWENGELKAYRQISSELAFIQGVIRRDTRIIPPESLRTVIIKTAHAGHVGASSMKRHVREHFWWPEMNVEIDKARGQCETCTLMQKDGPPAPMSRTQVPEAPWEYLALDYYSTDDPISLKILVLQDYYSKYVKAAIVNSTGTKEATDFLTLAFEEDGIPKKIISDNGPPFQGKDFADWCTTRQIKVTKSTPALPRANGMIERFMQSITRALTALKLDNGLTRETAKHAVRNLIFTYNRRPHSITERTPFSLLRGRESSDIFPSTQTIRTDDELKAKIEEKTSERKGLHGQLRGSEGRSHTTGRSSRHKKSYEKKIRLKPQAALVRSNRQERNRADVGKRRQDN